jgi:hypothetical protein
MRKISLNGLFCPKSFEIKQLLRTMKITLFLLLFVTFQAYCGNSYSQNAKVSIPDSQLRVGQILSQIESQTDYLFVYNKKSVDVRRTVNVDAKNKAVAELLDEIFAGTNIRYVMEGKNIVLTKRGLSRFLAGIIFYTREVLLTSHYEKRLFEHASQPRVACADIRLLSYLWSRTNLSRDSYQSG